MLLANLYPSGQSLSPRPLRLKASNKRVLLSSFSFPLIFLNVFREAGSCTLEKEEEEDERVVMRLLSRLIREANYKGEKKKVSKLTKRDGYPASRSQYTLA